MTRARFTGLVSLMLCGLGWAMADAKEFAQHAAGYNRARWQVVCQLAPYDTTTVFTPEVNSALEGEGWMENGSPRPSEGALNKVCRALGFLQDGGEAQLYGPQNSY